MIVMSEVYVVDISSVIGSVLLGSELEAESFLLHCNAPFMFINALNA